MYLNVMVLLLTVCVVQGNTKCTAAEIYKYMEQRDLHNFVLGCIRDVKRNMRGENPDQVDAFCNSSTCQELMKRSQTDALECAPENHQSFVNAAKALKKVCK